MVFPLASPLQAPHPDLPADAAALYEEARAVEPHSRRAALALARASLERFLRSRDGADPKARLADLIGDLKGQVTSLFGSYSLLSGTSATHPSTAMRMTTSWLRSSSVATPRT